MSEQLPAPSNGAQQPPNLPDGRVDTELFVPAGAIPIATPATVTATATAPLDTANGDVHMMDVSHDQPRVGSLREAIDPIPSPPTNTTKRSNTPPLTANSRAPDLLNLQPQPPRAGRTTATPAANQKPHLNSNHPHHQPPPPSPQTHHQRLLQRRATHPLPRRAAPAPQCATRTPAAARRSAQRRQQGRARPRRTPTRATQCRPSRRPTGRR